MIQNFIIVSDPHFYNNTAKSYKLDNGMSSWLYMQLAVMETILSTALKDNIHVVIVNGDIFEEKNRIPVSLYNAVWNLFKKYADRGLYIIFNTGNHDTLTKTSDSSLQPFSDIVHVISEPTKLWDCALIVPHGSIDFYNSGDMVPYSDAPISILILHEDISGLKYGDTDFEPNVFMLNGEKLIDAGWTYIFNGHIHKPQQLGSIINIGSMIRTDWGEANDDKRYILYSENKIISVPIACPRFISYDYLPANAAELIDNDNFFRFDINPVQVNNSIFKKWNVSYRITKSASDRTHRLQETSTVSSDIENFINITDTNLDREKLKMIGKQLEGDVR